MKFSGLVTEPSIVRVKGPVAPTTNVLATVTASTNFEASVNVSAGTNTVAVIAQDRTGNLNTTTNNYQVIVTSGGSKTLAYDLNGNLTQSVSGSVTNSYTWDARNELVGISSNGVSVASFSYDGLGRRTKIIQGGVTNAFLWCGAELCEKRDATGANVLTRFFDQGEQQGTTSLYYFRNHLGSVMEMTDSSGTIRARYNYDDPNGRTVKVSGDLDAAFRFHAMYYFDDDLYLTLFRGYRPSTATWLSRDPLGEGWDKTRYSYCFNDPVNMMDPLGLWGWDADYLQYGVGGLLGFHGNAGDSWGAFGEGAESGGRGIANAFTGGLFDPTAGLFYDECRDNEDFRFGLNAGRVAVGSLSLAGGAQAAGVNPWLGKVAIHGAHAGGPHQYLHLQLMLRTGVSRTSSLRIPLGPGP